MCAFYSKVQRVPELFNTRFTQGEFWKYRFLSPIPRNSDDLVGREWDQGICTLKSLVDLLVREVRGPLLHSTLLLPYQPWDRMCSCAWTWRLHPMSERCWRKYYMWTAHPAQNPPLLTPVNSSVSSVSLTKSELGKTSQLGRVLKPNM